MVTWRYNVFIYLILWIPSSGLFGYPEFVRYGYPSCTTCHVSPSGGGILTEYGRSFSAEKISTWSFKNEEAPLQGVKQPMPEWLLVGGNFRQIQTYIETPHTRNGRWIAMQRDIDMCVKNMSLYVCATAGITHHAEQSNSGKMKYGLRKAAVRFDIGESFMVRAGRFFPRFGLMIANHTSGVRKGMGFDAMHESDQVELTYLSERLEFTLAKEFGRVAQLNTETKEERAVFPKGTVASLTVPVGERNRAGLNYRLTEEEGDAHSYGAFAGLGLSEKTFLLLEVDQKVKVLNHPADGEEKMQRRTMTFTKLGTEPVRGFITYAQHEINLPDTSETISRKDTYGLGVQWYPRPHFEFDAFWGHMLMRQDSMYSTVGYFIFHYYL